MRKALVVGINNYSNAPLNGCVNDANTIANVLRTHGDSSPNFNVRLLTSPSSTIDRASLRKNIETLFAGKCDIALLYFSGHGFIKSTGGYLVTTDAKQYDEGVSMDDILNIANQSKVENKVIVLDCCHSGALGSPSITGNTIAQLSEGMSVLTASRDSESAMEINGSGVFTSLVVDALKGGAADLRGNITPGSIYAWDQRPIFKTNITRFTSLRTINPQVPLKTLRKIIEYFPSPQEEYQLDPSYEDTNTKMVEHNVIEPYAIAENVAVFKSLQKFESVGLVVPIDEEHMYFAAMHSKSCRLTALGYQYWRLVEEKKI